MFDQMSDGMFDDLIDTKVRWQGLHSRRPVDARSSRLQHRSTPAGTPNRTLHLLTLTFRVVGAIKKNLPEDQAQLPREQELLRAMGGLLDELTSDSAREIGALKDLLARTTAEVAEKIRLVEARDAQVLKARRPSHDSVCLEVRSPSGFGVRTRFSSLAKRTARRCTRVRRGGVWSGMGERPMRPRPATNSRRRRRRTGRQPRFSLGNILSFFFQYLGARRRRMPTPVSIRGYPKEAPHRGHFRCCPPTRSSPRCSSSLSPEKSRARMPALTSLRVQSRPVRARVCKHTRAEERAHGEARPLSQELLKKEKAEAVKQKARMHESEKQKVCTHTSTSCAQAHRWRCRLISSR